MSYMPTEIERNDWKLDWETVQTTAGERDIGKVSLVEASIYRTSMIAFQRSSPSGLVDERILHPGSGKLLPS